MKRGNNRIELRAHRHRRIRKRISGSQERPRMSVMISQKNMYVQFIDDDAQKTLAAASTAQTGGRPNLENAKTLGQKAGEAARAAGIKSIVVDRGGHRYHGRVKAIVDAAIEAGLSVGNHAKVESEDTAEVALADVGKEDS